MSSNSSAENLPARIGHSSSLRQSAFYLSTGSLPKPRTLFLCPTQPPIRALLRKLPPMPWRVWGCGVPVSIVRLPPSVHGEGDRAFVPTLIDIARAKGFSAYVGNGENRWPAVHRRDAARLYRLAAERASTHARYHAVAEEGIPLRNIATAIGTGLDLPVVPIDAEAALDHFGWFNHFAAMDIRASGAETRRNLGWSPSGSTLLEDLAGGIYFGGS
jgi:nucleoside-diphosphate-sugar epimerase